MKICFKLEDAILAISRNIHFFLKKIYIFLEDEASTI
jgi:hypothetical protein